MMRDVFCQRVEDDAFHRKSLTQSAIGLCWGRYHVCESSEDRKGKARESSKPSYLSPAEAAENLKRYE
jgi:hypothetical protein